MGLFIDKLKETLTSIVPIVILVWLLSLFVVDIPGEMIARFLIGAVLLILGLTIFLFGIDIGMSPIGDEMGQLIAKGPSIVFIFAMSFLLGFSVTIAEPDLLVLGQQIADATNGALPPALVVAIVALGVGVMIAFGMLRILKGTPLKYFYLSIYALIFLLALPALNQWIAIGFDSSGATTGSLTTPFILALGASASTLKGGSQSESDSFGLVGAMSTGPILAILLLALFSRTEFSGDGGMYQYTEGIVAPFVDAIIPTTLETLLSLAPIVIIFFVMNWRYFQLDSDVLGDITKGVLYTFIGLVLFLIGVNQGFFDMGHYLGEAVAEYHENWLPLVGGVLGLVAVLAEPAVHVLGKQVEDITGGFIRRNLLSGAFSLAVGIAAALAMLRIMIPGLELWHFLLIFFGLSLFLAFFVDDLFTGIAFDAGGVASGPMTATFILAFSQGAAAYLPQANAVTDGFGLIAMVAMLPVTVILLLGVIVKQSTRA